MISSHSSIKSSYIRKRPTDISSLRFAAMQYTVERFLPEFDINVATFPSVNPLTLRTDVFSVKYP